MKKSAIFDAKRFQQQGPKIAFLDDRVSIRNNCAARA